LWALGCSVKSFREKCFVWKLQDAGSCPGFLSQAPRPLPAGAVSISTLSWLRLLCQGLECVPAAKFTVDQAGMSFSAWIQLMLILTGYVIS
jgi:hypothetical protein